MNDCSKHKKVYYIKITSNYWDFVIKTWQKIVTHRQTETENIQIYHRLLIKHNAILILDLDRIDLDNISDLVL